MADLSKLNALMEQERSESTVLWENDEHKFIWLGVGDPEEEKGIPSSQYLIVDRGDSYILDPGGYHVFNRVFNNLLKHTSIDGIKGLFFSHQDPDVTTSLISWLEVKPEVEVIMSRLWSRFIAHLALPVDPNCRLLEDEGETLTLPSGGTLEFIPAHFLHSCGNFFVYDSTAKILFSGDVGSALLPPGRWYKFVEDFDEHATFMEGFHRRYLGSTKALKVFLDRIKGLEIEMICPQHDPIFTGDNVGRFIDWLDSLDAVGVDYMYS